MTHCSGMLGKVCTCGEWHDTTDFHQETAVRSLLAAPAFWLCGAICALCWVPVLVAIWKY